MPDPRGARVGLAFTRERRAAASALEGGSFREGPGEGPVSPFRYCIFGPDAAASPCA
jgi:hypothetical protein